LSWSSNNGRLQIAFSDYSVSIAGWYIKSSSWTLKNSSSISYFQEVLRTTENITATTQDYLPGQEGSNRKVGDELPLTLFFFKVKYKYEKNP